MSEEVAPQAPVAHAPTKTGLSSIIILAILAALPALFATGFTSFEMLRREVFTILVAMALAIWGVETLRAKRVHLGAGRAIIPLVLFGVWITLTPAWSPMWLVGALDVSGLVAACALALMLAAPASRPITWSQLSGAIGLGTALAGLFGLLDLAGVSLFTQIWDPEGASGSFDSLEFASSYYMIALPLLAAGVATGHKVARGLSAAVLLLGSAHLALSGTSIAQPVLMLIALGLPIGWMMLQRASTRGVKPLALGAAALILVASALGPFVVKTQLDPYNASTSTPIIAFDQIAYNPEGLKQGIPRNTRFAISRYEQIKSAQEHDYLAQVRDKMIAEKPVTGQGAGGWWLSQTRVVFPEHPYMQGLFDIYPAFRSTHSGYLKVLIEYGAIGMMLMGLWLIGALMLLVDLGRSPRELPEDHGTLVAGLGATLIAGALAIMDTAAMDSVACMAVWLGALGFLATYAAQLPEDAQRGWSEVWRGDGHAFSPALLSICFAASLLTLGAVSVTSHYLRSKGDQFMIYNKFEEAAPAYSSAHEVLPAYGEVLYNQVLAESQRREARLKLQEREELLQLARVLRPDDARLLHTQALAYTNSAKPKDAMELEKTTLHRFPGYLDAYKNLALSYNRTLDFKEATETFETMLALNPPNSVKVGTSESVAQLYEGPLKNPTKALVHYKEALRLAQLTFMKERLTARVKELEKRVERERLMREGKPIPKHLMPEEAHDAAGEILGTGGGHEGHDH